MAVDNNVLNTLFAPLDGGDPSWTRDLSPSRKVTADSAAAKVAALAPAWHVDLSKYNTDVVDLVDVHLPAFGPFLVYQRQDSGKTHAYDAFWTDRNATVTVVDLGSPYTWG